jgi:hypothetical protein
MRSVRYSPNFFLVDHRDSNTRSGGKALEDAKKWLSPPDPSQNYNTLLGVHREGTTAWLFKNDTYKKWKSGGSLLWINGLRSCISALYRLFVDTCLSSGLWKERALVRHFSTLFFYWN